MAAIVGSGPSGTAAASSSDVSAVTWITKSGSQETRVYYQDNAGNIRERACSNGSWTQGNGGNPLTTASPGTNISANYFYQEVSGGVSVPVPSSEVQGSSRL